MLNFCYAPGETVTPRRRAPDGPRRYDLQDVAIRRYSQSPMLHWDGVNAAAPPSDTCNYIIYVHATHRKERSQCYNAGSLLNKYNLLKNKHAKSSSGSHTQAHTCMHTHTYSTHTQLVISREREMNSISVPRINNNIHQIHSKPRNNSSSKRAQFEYRAFTTMVPI